MHKKNNIDLKWLKDLLEHLPKISKSRRNLIDIAGYPSWETVNSNLLAFYFDEKEDHNFGRLFFNSLIEIIETKIPEKLNREVYEITDYTVEREVVTNKGKYIDIVIREESDEENRSNIEDWAIIIENKLKANLYNDLENYWRTIDASSKIGIVLSIKPILIDKKFKKKEIFYVNILHLELIERIKQNLSEYFEESDDRHLLFLKEYFANIISYYENKNKTQKMDETLKLFQKNKENIKKLKEADMELLKYVSTVVFKVMAKNEFPPYTLKASSKGKHFQITDNTNIESSFIMENIEMAKMFRFWINLSQLRYNNNFMAFFELWSSDFTQYGDILKEKLSEKNIFNDKIKLGIGGKSGAGYQHIYAIDLELGDFDGKTFEEKLGCVLEKEFFNHQNKFVELAITELRKIIENK